MSAVSNVVSYRLLRRINEKKKEIVDQQQENKSLMKRSSRSGFDHLLFYLESSFIRLINLRALWGISEVVAIFSATLNCAD